MPDRPCDRAVSEVLGYVLVFSMVLAAITFVSISGFATLEDARDAEQHNNAERAFDVLANNVEDVYKRGAPSRATELSLDGTQLSVGEEVGLRVSVDGSTRVDTTIRPLVFQGSDGVALVYEAGAVFRTQRQGGYVVRGPPLQSSSEQLLFTVVRTNRSNVQSIGGSSVLVRTVARGTDVAVRSSGGHDVTIELVDSPRQELWHRHLEEARGLSCGVSGDTLSCDDSDTDPDRVLVTVTDVHVELET